MDGFNVIFYIAANRYSMRVCVTPDSHKEACSRRHTSFACMPEPLYARQRTWKMILFFIIITHDLNITIASRV